MSVQDQEPFVPDIEGVGCLLEYDGKVLWLRRAPNERVFPTTWGIPSGKVEASESRETALVREVLEETNIAIDEPTLCYIASLNVHHGGANLTYHVFHVELTERPDVFLNENENDSYQWEAPERMRGKPDLIPGADAVIDTYLEWKMRASE